MAKKWFIAKEEGMHSLTGLDLVRGGKYLVEETLAGPAIFDLAKDQTPPPDEDGTGGSRTAPTDKLPVQKKGGK